MKLLSIFGKHSAFTEQEIYTILRSQEAADKARQEKVYNFLYTDSTFEKNLRSHVRKKNITLNTSQEEAYQDGKIETIITFDSHVKQDKYVPQKSKSWRAYCLSIFGFKFLEALRKFYPIDKALKAKAEVAHVEFERQQTLATIEDPIYQAVLYLFDRSEELFAKIDWFQHDKHGQRRCLLFNLKHQEKLSYKEIVKRMKTKHIDTNEAVLRQENATMIKTLKVYFNNFFND